MWCGGRGISCCARGAGITGIVLNAVDLNSPEYYGYYGYSVTRTRVVDSESWESQKPSRKDARESEESER